jgi:hypothetical protein
MFSMVLIDGKPYARGLLERSSIMWLDPNAKDRFGLPHRPPETEDEAARRERLNHVRNLIVDATLSVARQVGDREARLLFKLAFQKPPKGRRADDKENAILLAAYDAALARGVPRKRAARVTADNMSVPNDDPEAIAKRIRRLAKKRDRENALDLLLLMNILAPGHFSIMGPRQSRPQSDK